MPKRWWLYRLTYPIVRRPMQLVAMAGFRSTAKRLTEGWLAFCGYSDVTVHYIGDGKWEARWRPQGG